MKLQRDIIIFKKEGSYSCFPVLEQLADGRLMVALTQREFPSHNSKGRLRLFLEQQMVSIGKRQQILLWPQCGQGLQENSVVN